MLKPTQDKNALLTDDERIKVTNEICKKYHIKWADWENLSDRDLESFIIDCYKAIGKAQLEKLDTMGYHVGLPSHIEEALNSGDGTYRP